MNDPLILSVFSGSLWQIIGSTSAFGIFIDLVLISMSIVSWVIIINKYKLFRAVDADTARFIAHFDRSNDLSESLGQARNSKTSPLAAIFTSGLKELSAIGDLRNQGGSLQESQKQLINEDFELIEMAMDKTHTQQVSHLETRVSFLATTGSAAPFMGLLGTVVGIMDSFWSIGERGSASLAVVAPGIAEALLATIVGLAVAIPAVIAYNWANARLKEINDQATGFILEFLARARKENI